MFLFGVASIDKFELATPPNPQLQRSLYTGVSLMSKRIRLFLWQR